MQPLPELHSILDRVFPNLLFDANFLFAGLAQDDGNLILLDITDPATGSVLVTGDEGSGVTRQLQVILESACDLYLPRKLQACIVSSSPEDWESIIASHPKHIQSLSLWYDRKVTETIMDLSSLANDRRAGRRRGAPVILIIDNLPRIQSIDYEAQINLHWLLEYGPQSGIWPIVGVIAEETQDITYWTQPFRSRLMGQINSPTLMTDLALMEGCRSQILQKGTEFNVWTGTEWLVYAVPMIEYRKEK